MFLSYSKLNTFRQCPLRYKLQYVNRLPGRPKRYVKLGRIVHATIRRAYQYAQEGRFTLDQLRQHYEEVWEVRGQPEVRYSNEYRTGLQFM